MTPDDVKSASMWKICVQICWQPRLWIWLRNPLLQQTLRQKKKLLQQQKNKKTAKAIKMNEKQMGELLVRPL